MKTSNTFKTTILLVFMALGSSILFNACKDDPCDDQVCLNGGTCNDGNCDCPVGYEDSNCGTETRAKFLSLYNVTSSCDPSFSYTQTLSTSATDVTKFVIKDIGNVAGLNALGRVTGGNAFIIDSQTLTDSDGETWSVSGTGLLNGNIISANISYNWIGVGTLNCSETWTKQ